MGHGAVRLDLDREEPSGVPPASGQGKVAGINRPTRPVVALRAPDEVDVVGPELSGP